MVILFWVYPKPDFQCLLLHVECGEKDGRLGVCNLAHRVRGAWASCAVIFDVSGDLLTGGNHDMLTGTNL